MIGLAQSSLSWIKYLAKTILTCTCKPVYLGSHYVHYVCSIKEEYFIMSRNIIKWHINLLDI